MFKIGESTLGLVPNIKKTLLSSKDLILLLKIKYFLKSIFKFRLVLRLVIPVTEERSFAVCKVNRSTRCPV